MGKRLGYIARLASHRQSGFVFALAFEHLIGVGRIHHIPEIAQALMFLTRHGIIRPAQKTDGAIARAVGKKRGREPYPASRPDLLRHHGCEAMTAGFHRKHAMFEQKGDLGFGSHQIRFAGIGINRAALGVAGAGSFRWD